MKGGANRKSVSEHIRDGSFRPGRHMDQLTAAAVHAPDQPPTRPRSLKGEARKLWDLIVPELRGVVGPRDTGSLVLLCTSYAEWLRACKAIESVEPGEAEHGRIARTMNSFFTTYEKLAAKFGLDPFSRERLPPVEGVTAEDIEELKRRVRYFNDHEARAKLVRLGVETQMSPVRQKTKLDKEGKPK